MGSRVRVKRSHTSCLQRFPKPLVFAILKSFHSSQRLRGKMGLENSGKMKFICILLRGTTVNSGKEPALQFLPDHILRPNMYHWAQKSHGRVCCLCIVLLFQRGMKASCCLLLAFREISSLHSYTWLCREMYNPKSETVIKRCPLQGPAMNIYSITRDNVQSH